MKNEFFDTDVEPLDQAKSKAQRALQELPVLSVRSVISLGFALWFILSIGITIASFVILTEIQEKLYFMESAGGYLFKLQEARRFEKNYFINETNLDAPLEQVRLAHDILELNSGKMAAVVGEQPVQIMVHHINRYEDLLYALKKKDKQQRPVASESDQSRIEDELRKHGAVMVAAAENLLDRERKSVNDLIYLSKRGPMVFLLVLLGLMIFCSILLPAR